MCVRACRFGHPFETPLLLQSILTVIAMVGLMELCARLEPQTQVKHKFLGKQIYYAVKICLMHQVIILLRTFLSANKVAPFYEVQSAKFVHILRTIIQAVLTFNFLAWHVLEKSGNSSLVVLWQHVLRHPTVLYLHSLASDLL